MPIFRLSKYGNITGSVYFILSTAMMVDNSAGSPKISDLSTAMMVVVDDFCWICKIQKMTPAMLLFRLYT